jgi:aminoglycoside 6-adenylyltransferase
MASFWARRSIVIDEIIQWAEHEKHVRAVILTGSRATNKHDELSDYDLALLCTDIDSLTYNDAWLSKIGRVWVCVHEKICIQEKEFPCRLVIFEKGIKVDFSFYPVKVLKDITNVLFQSDYKVLLDKEAMIISMPFLCKEVSVVVKPTLEQFLTIINEFWFEAYHVAVYLKRGDLWSAQFRLNGIHHQFLLKMIEWDELSKTDWKGFLPELGKKMQSWVSKDTWNALHQSFAKFDEKDTWNALENTASLFRTLAHQAAAQLDYNYPNEVDKHISKFINELRGNL